MLRRAFEHSRVQKRTKNLQVFFKTEILRRVYCRVVWLVVSQDALDDCCVYIIDLTALMMAQESISKAFNKSFGGPL